MSALARRVPLVLHFPERDGRNDGWGRFLELAADGARAATLTRLTKGDCLRVSFEAAGEKVELLRADVESVQRDLDGYFVAELRFLDEETRGRLAKAFLSLSASS
ncbi:MAG: hypothetical protein WCU88_05220 [Elusimicrobiota bacterium]